MWGSTTLTYSTPSMDMATLSFVTAVWFGTGMASSFRCHTYAIWSTTGINRWIPACSVVWNLPKRSTTTAARSGTTLMPRFAGRGATARSRRDALYAREPEGTESPPKRPSPPNATVADEGSAAVSGRAPPRRAARARSARAEDAARMIVAIGRARRVV